MVQGPPAAPEWTLSTIWFIGQFHGVISAQTPMGWCRIISPGAQSPSGCSHSKLFAARRNPSMCHVPEVTWFCRDISIGAPISPGDRDGEIPHRARFS